MSLASDKWMEFYNQGRIQDDTALGRRWGFILILETTYDDGSILRWSDRDNRWKFYDDHKKLAWDQKLGRA